MHHTSKVSVSRFEKKSKLVPPKCKFNIINHSCKIRKSEICTGQYQTIVIQRYQCLDLRSLEIVKETFSVTCMIFLVW